MVNIQNQYFGLELEFTGISRMAAAQAIAEVINGNRDCEYEGGVYRKYTVKDSMGRKWTVERDASIFVEGGEECEFVTPKCSYDDIHVVQECIRALRKAGAKVNSSCGIHIHVDGSNHNAKSLKNLVFTFRAKEDLIFKAVETQKSRLERWCKPIDDSLVRNIKKVKNLDEASLSKVWYETYSYGDGRSNHYDGSRYHALNLHSMWYRGTVEFRLFESTLHAGKVRAYITFCLALSAYAINSKRASANPMADNGGNDKFEFRCFMKRIGMVGDEYANCRKHLLKNLAGDAAWRDGENRIGA